MSKENLNPIERRQMIVDMISRGQHYLNDFIEEIPNRIISGGFFLDGSASNPDRPHATTHKCQRNWFMKVVGWAGLIRMRFPEDEELVVATKRYGAQICARSQIDPLLDPLHVVDDHGDVHRLTTEDEIRQTNEFLVFAIARLKSKLT